MNSIAGETIIKLYYWKQIDGYVTIPGDSLFQRRGGWVLARTYWLRLFKRSTSKESCAWSPSRRGRCESDRGAPEITTLRFADPAVNGAMGEANSKTNRDPEYHFVQKQRHGLRVTIAMDQLGHVDYPVPLSVQENFATVAIYQRFSFDQNPGLDSHRER